MPAMNYKEATGVRARTDLSANTKPARSYGISDEQLTLVYNELAKHAREGTVFRLVPSLSGRLADAVVEVLNRRGDHP